MNLRSAIHSTSRHKICERIRPGGCEGLAAVAAAQADRVDAHAAAAGLAAAAAGGHEAAPELFSSTER